MALKNPPSYLTGSFSAEQDRLLVAALTGAPVGQFTAGVGAGNSGGGHGIVGQNDLLVTETSPVSLSVKVAAGSAFVRGSTSGVASATQGVYSITNDGDVAVALQSGDQTHPRRDLIVLTVRDAAYSGAQNDAVLQVVQGTPDASPADPTVPANSLVLARVQVPAQASGVINSYITDLRPRANALGGTKVCTSGSRPPSPFTGQLIYETDTSKVRVWTGSGWEDIFPVVAPQSQQVPAGSVIQYAGETAPSGYLLCNGLSFQTSAYPSLFSAIGYTYGGSGTIFQVPDLRSRVAVGLDAFDTAFSYLGQVGGEKTHQLTTAEMPSHTHQQNAHSHVLNDPTHTHGDGAPAGDIVVTQFGGTPTNTLDIFDGGATPLATNTVTQVANASTGITLDAAVATNQSSGGGYAHNNLQPYITLNYIIKT